MDFPVLRTSWSPIKRAEYEPEVSLEPHGHGHAFSPLGRPLPALRLRLGVGLAVDELGLLRLEGGRARDVVRVEGEHVDPVAVALQRPAQRAVRRAPHLDGAVLRGQIRVVQGLR